MTVTAQTRIDWENVNYTIERTLVDLKESREWHRIQAGRRGLERFEYIGGLLTAAVQSEVDFRYQERHDWKAVCDRLTSVYKSYASSSRETRIVAVMQSKRKRLESLAGELTRHAAELINFEDRKAGLHISAAT